MRLWNRVVCYSLSLLCLPCLLFLLCLLTFPFFHKESYTQQKVVCMVVGSTPTPTIFFFYLWLQAIFIMGNRTNRYDLAMVSATLSQINKYYLNSLVVGVEPHPVAILNLFCNSLDGRKLNWEYGRRCGFAHGNSCTCQFWCNVQIE